MKQTLFETRQKAEYLLKEAMNIWRQNDLDGSLDGLENDPVFMLLLSAVAYQSNEIEMDIERLKQEVLTEFIHKVVPYELVRAVPASVIVAATLSPDAVEQQMDETQAFTIAGTPYSFMPLMKTRIIGAEVASIVRLDGRRWQVSLNFRQPTSDLSGFSFAITNALYDDLKVSHQGQEIPLIKPQDYYEMPLNDCFAYEHIYHTGEDSFDALIPSVEMVLRRGVAQYIIRQGTVIDNHAESTQIDLVFEFGNITSEFEFSSKVFRINTVQLVNVRKQKATLSNTNPIARLAGVIETQSGEVKETTQYISMLRHDKQMYGDVPVEVRRVSGDRFTQSSLIKMLGSLTQKLHSDYYAFLHINGTEAEALIRRINHLTSRLQALCDAQDGSSSEGTYAILRLLDKKQLQNFSVELEYLTTEGAGPNSALASDPVFQAPEGLISVSSENVLCSEPGFDELRSEAASQDMARYFMTTHDRLVTPADYKAFCYMQLHKMFSIDRSMVHSIVVTPHRNATDRVNNYEILVDIKLENRHLIHRNFEEKIPMAIRILTMMMQSRGLGMYPPRVTISILGTPNSNGLQK